MGKYLVKLIESGMDYASEAISSARNNSTKNTSIHDGSSSRDLTIDQSDEFQYTEKMTGAIISDGYIYSPAPINSHIHQQYTELPVCDEVSLHRQHAELPAEYDPPVHETYLPIISEKQHNDPVEVFPATQREISPEPETAQDWDAYSESNYSIDLDREIDQTEAVWNLDETARDLPPSYEESEFPPGVAYVNEDNQVRQEDHMIRDLVQMAGPVQSTQRISCPVFIPQRRPGNKYRGFVRAYAPVLDSCGISSDLFLEFLEDFYQASMSSGWLDVVSISADIEDYENRAQITDLIVQVVAGTMQSQDRANTFLDRVNQEIFMPRGVYAMVVEFKDEIPSQQQASLSSLSQRLGKTLFATENVDISQPASSANEAGLPHSHIELPEVAPLIFPDLDQEPKYTTSAMTVQSPRPGFVSRYYNPTHHCGNKKLLSVLTHGKLGNKPGLIKRAATSIQESRNAKRMSHGSRGAIKGCQKHRGTNPLTTKSLQPNVKYLMLVNIPTREETEQSISQLERLMHHTGRHG